MAKMVAQQTSSQMAMCFWFVLIDGFISACGDYIACWRQGGMDFNGCGIILQTMKRMIHRKDAKGAKFIVFCRSIFYISVG